MKSRALRFGIIGWLALLAIPNAGDASADAATIAQAGFSGSTRMGGLDAADDVPARPLPLKLPPSITT